MGQDITHVINRNLHFIGSGKGELVCDENRFKLDLSFDFANSRNVIASIIKKAPLNPKIESFVNKRHAVFIAFSDLDEIIVTMDQFVKDHENIVKTLRGIKYPTDGIVIEIIDDEAKKLLGDTKKHHRWQIALKERGLAVPTKVVKVDAQVGRTGRVTPVIYIEPTTLQGSTIEKLTGHNFELLTTKGVGPGSEITITKGGDVIPRLVGVLTEAKLEIPKKCPCCNYLLEKDGAYLVCNNSRCKDQVVATIEFFCKENKLKGFGPSVIGSLVDTLKLKNVEDLLKMSYEECLVGGMGEKRCFNLTNEIQRYKRSL